MSNGLVARIRNAEAVRTASLPLVSIGVFRQTVVGMVNRGARIAALFGSEGKSGTVRVIAVLAHDEEGELSVLSADVGGSYESLTPDCAQAHWFERELAEQWGVTPRGHPWLKPIRFQSSCRSGGESPSPCGVTSFFQVAGEEIHEVAVGPVHAGVIEPGHFRFQCYGEEVLHLEISLGYQHRGVERALLGGPDRRTIPYIETLAGDTSAGHATAHCQAIEAIGRCGVPPRGLVLRAVALELERIANHVGDLGALAGDVGFLPTAAYCGRIRGDVLNMTALICGSRFGRGLIRPGGTAVDVEEPIVVELLNRLDSAATDISVADALLWETSSAMARFENTGVIPFEVCEEIGLVGPAARACGADRDVRKDHPFGIYQFAHIPTCTWDTGDVFGRAHVRSIEIKRSIAFIREQLESLPPGEVRAAVHAQAPVVGGSFVVSLAEGWRGEICHVVQTGDDARFARYKVVDPSFHNWFGLAYALRGQQISDFPLCNKSFNLSYCGHDL